MRNPTFKEKLEKGNELNNQIQKVILRLLGPVLFKYFKRSFL